MRNNNRKVIGKLSSRNMKKNRMRNLFAIGAICLTSLLFTAVFSMGIGMGQAFQEQTMMEVGGKFHAGLKNVTREQYEKITDNPLVKSSSYNIYVGIAENVKQRQAEIRVASGIEELDQSFARLKEGRLPREKGELAADTLTLEALGIPAEIGEKVNSVYASVIIAGTHLAPSIKVAEAAKVIENSQRDINIAFVNELSKIFNKLGIDTQDVLEAASTKWNFLPFKPGLVGGHCIGVDPYYLAQCAQRHGYNPEIILAGRRMNDGMGEYVATEVVKLMLKKGIQVLNSDILILGFTFKENCPDVRNTKVIDIYNTLKDYGVNITVYDPWANPDIAKREYGIEIINELPDKKFDAAIAAVAHKLFENIDVSSLLKDKHVIFDVKCTLDRGIIDARL